MSSDTVVELPSQPLDQQYVRWVAINVYIFANDGTLVRISVDVRIDGSDLVVVVHNHERFEMDGC